MTSVASENGLGQLQLALFGVEAYWSSWVMSSSSRADPVSPAVPVGRTEPPLGAVQ